MIFQEKTIIVKKEFISSLAPQVYSTAENIANKTRMFSDHPIEINAESAFCTLVNDVATNILKKNGFKADYVTQKAELKDFIDHTHIVVGNNTIVDFQYLQFVPKELRNNLPNCLVIASNEKEDILKELRNHSIPEQLHHLWLS